MAIYPKNWAFPGFAWKKVPKMLHSLSYRFPKRGCNWGTLRIPREDWGTLGNTYKLSKTNMEPPKNGHLVQMNISFSKGGENLRFQP